VLRRIDHAIPDLKQHGLHRAAGTGMSLNRGIAHVEDERRLPGGIAGNLIQRGYAGSGFAQCPFMIHHLHGFVTGPGGYALGRAVAARQIRRCHRHSKRYNTISAAVNRGYRLGFRSLRRSTVPSPSTPDANSAMLPGSGVVPVEVLLPRMLNDSEGIDSKKSGNASEGQPSE
jgi:hypothetical protein